MSASDFNTVNNLVSLDGRAAMSSSTSSRESSTSPAPPKMAADSGCVSENSERSDESMLLDASDHIVADTQFQLAKHYTAQTLNNVNDDRILSTGLQSASS
jgi:hypothetical protein